MPGKQLLMTFPVTATSHTLADYVGRGGYATLRRVLTQMKPEDVTKEVTAGSLPCSPATFGSDPPKDGGHQEAWSGTLKLPPVKISVKEKAK